MINTMYLCISNDSKLRHSHKFINVKRKIEINENKIKQNKFTVIFGNRGGINLVYLP